MTADEETEYKLLEKVKVSEVDGEIHVVFKQSLDWVLFLRKIAVHKHLKEEGHVDVLDDVIDCDHMFLAVAEANEAFVKSQPPKKGPIVMPFEGTAHLPSDHHTFHWIMKSLKRKIENGPCDQESEKLESHRLFIKKYFAPFLITNEQVDEIVKELGMRTDRYYGLAR